MDNHSFNQDYFVSLLLKTNREGIDQLIDWLYSTDFFATPASSKFHHQFQGGLCYHSLKVYERLEMVYKKYIKSGGMTVIPKESLIISALLHDVCKINSYFPKYTENVEKSSDNAEYKFIDTLPLGHGEKSIWLIENHVHLTIPEALAIRWHMGLRYHTGIFERNAIREATKITPLVALLQQADNTYISYYEGENLK